MSDHKFKETEQKIEIPVEVAMQLKIMEFDQVIARTEEQVATLKKQRIEFILSENVNIIKARYAPQHGVPNGLIEKPNLSILKP